MTLIIIIAISIIKGVNSGGTVSRLTVASDIQGGVSINAAIYRWG